MITITVIHSNTGKPAKGMRVNIEFEGLMRGMGGSQYTNDMGEAHYNNDPGRGTVFVDGRSAHSGRLEGRVIVYV